MRVNSVLLEVKSSEFIFVRHNGFTLMLMAEVDFYFENLDKVKLSSTQISLGTFDQALLKNCNV